jgi:hypothetical protein
MRVDYAEARVGQVRELVDVDRRSNDSRELALEYEASTDSGFAADHLAARASRRRG